MSKWIPSLIVSVFAVAFTLRIGTFGYDYYGQWLSAQAETVSKIPTEAQTDKTSQIKTLPSQAKTKEKLVTVKDKILKISDYKNNKTQYSYKEAGAIKDKSPNNICITSPMLQDAVKQLEYLDKRDLEVKTHLKMLETSDRRVREQIAKLKLIKDDIVESAKLADSKIQKESKHLISIYEKMKPKEAAKIFNEMAPNIAAELLRTMKEDHSSKILSKMDPKIAYNVTLSLAGGIKKTKDKYNTLK